MSTDDNDRLTPFDNVVNGENRRDFTVVLQPVRGEHTTQPMGTGQGQSDYLAGALSEAEAQAIRWHSPSSARSSQVFCISAFGSLRHLPDGQHILQALLARHFPDVGLAGPWKLTLEYPIVKCLMNPAA